MNPKIEQAVQNLVSVIQHEFMQEAAETVLAAFGGSKAVKRRLSPNGVEELPWRAAPSKRVKKGQKRDPKAISNLADGLAATIENFPGEGIEKLGKRLNVPTKDLALPVKKLLAAKRIKTKGQKRATKYFVR